LEEIALRDGVDLCHILQREPFLGISSDPRLGRNDKLKRIKEEVRRLRFPRLTSMEEAIRITVPPGLEGGLTVQMRAASRKELERLVGELSQLLEKKAVQEIFSLLEGAE